MLTITRKKLLYKSGVEYADYCVNHIAGCAHGCTYPCYAFLMGKAQGRCKTEAEWREPKLVSNSLALLDKEIPKLKHNIKEVHLCFTSDPFMHGYGEVADMSVAILGKLNSNGIPCTTLTKGVYPADKIHAAGDINLTKFGITLVSLDEGFREQYEPGAAHIEERIVGLRRLHELGYQTWVSMEPYPTPNIIKQSLTDILEAVSFADRIVFGRWNYSKLISGYKGFREFFNAEARTVVNFCEERGIDCYIKEGTVTE